VARQICAQPRLGNRPLPHDGRSRSSHDFGRFLDGEAPEVAQLDDLRLPTIEGGQTLEGFVQRQDIDPAGFRGDLIFDQGHALQPPAALLGEPFPGVIDEDSPHHPGGDAEEVRPVAPLRLSLVNEPHVGFVNERRWLQRMTGWFSLHVAGRQTAQVPVNERQQVLEGIPIPVAPGDEPLRDRCAVRVVVSHSWTP
jgi:hypothetical protein